MPSTWSSPCGPRPLISQIADLTFAAQLAANSQGECQILNSTRSLYLPEVPLILTFAKVPAEWGANVGIGPLAQIAAGVFETGNSPSAFSVSTESQYSLISLILPL